MSFGAKQMILAYVRKNCQQTGTGWHGEEIEWSGDWRIE